MAELTDAYRLVFYDQCGSDRSLAPLDSASITLENFLADLDAVSEAQGLEQMNLLGHSWGGLLAMLYASRYPDRVKSLILNEHDRGRSPLQRWSFMEQST